MTSIEQAMRGMFASQVIFSYHILNIDSYDVRFGNVQAITIPEEYSDRHRDQLLSNGFLDAGNTLGGVLYKRMKI